MNSKRTNLTYNTTSILGMWSQGLDGNLLSIEFRLVRVREISGRKWPLPIRKVSVRNAVRRWKDPAVAACTLQPAQSPPKEIVSDWEVAERLNR